MSTEETEELDRPDVVLTADGPILIRGDHLVADPDGTLHRTRRPVTAVCACGHSMIQPWCDGTHKLLTGRARRSGPAGRRDSIAPAQDISAS